MFIVFTHTCLPCHPSQVIHMRKAYGVPLAFMLMNSFSTSDDTLKALKSYKGLAADLDLEFQ